MRACAGLADALIMQGHDDEAIQIWKRMLELNPNDNQGMRDLLMIALLRNKRHDELQEILDRYHDDCGVVHAYSTALLQFRRQSDSPAAQQSLRRAVALNPFMEPYLTGRKPLPKTSPSTYSPGQQSEADAFIHELFPAWQDTPGAAEWVLSKTDKLPPRPPPPRRGRKW